ncbi:O-acetyl-ADP-ribose deacetylase (regulator of RNase III), contains Macro domain [Butyrivibrio sp. ob235]|uniref:macro domain-containing protein n=1 Tax=Butyrivibrio sp. ob235 TaxID=1761780 RepID=UPI0008AE0FF0|nr:macro domain-containing protein [Butyrivibrio sp. ob235]SEL76857.1 O-acetyl-ADP-ribose deacetylase (regulator of RNase III), contains Macro domain [Butyrivibrio sp. ob235]
MPFSIIRNDITKVKADAIVNTANPDVAIGDGVDAAIYKAAGEEKLFAARREIGVLEPGEVGITPAFDLDAKYIIHASGPWWEGGNKGEAELLRKCYDKSLILAADNGCESIAFPLLATGTYGFPKELGIQIAVDAFTAFLLDHEMLITLVVFGEYAYHVSGKIFDDVKSFIDEEYVSAALEDEYQYDGIPEEPMEYMQCATAFSDEESDAGTSEERDEEEEFDEDWEEEQSDLSDEIGFPEPNYIKTQGGPREKGKNKRGIFADAMKAMSAARMGKAKESAPMECQAEMMFGTAKESQSLDDALKEMYTDSFEKHLQQLINKKGLKNSEIYAVANISKQYFSKLLKGQVKPSKEKVLSLAVGLRLNLDETVDFLRLAGYALSPISQTDVVVKYFIIHEDYNVMKIDITLFDYGLDPLSKG